jgi:hypothetical protein
LKGQQYAEWLMHLLLIAFGVSSDVDSLPFSLIPFFLAFQIIGWIVGFLMQSFQVTVMIVAAGVVVLCIVRDLTLSRATFSHPLPSFS